jgi:hypothetical protein
MVPMLTVLVVLALVLAVIGLLDLAAAKFGVDSRVCSNDPRAPRGELSL